MQSGRIYTCFIVILIATICESIIIKKTTKNNDDKSSLSTTAGSSSVFDSCFNDTGVPCNHRARLFSHLFDNYNDNIRPFCGNNDVINSTLDIAIRQLMELDEPMQVLRLNAWIRLRWYDCQLVWNATEFGGINNIVVKFENIWVPDISLYDSVADEFTGYLDFRPVVNSNGVVTYNFPTIIEVQCYVDVNYFPFDTQRCPLVFGSWAHNGHELDFIPKDKSGDLSAAQINTEWDIIGFETQRNVKYYKCCPEPYTDATFTLEIKRKPLFYLVNIIIPTVLITLIGILVFVLSVESGEKVGLAITVMLALSVLQLLVSDTLPPSAETIPLIAIYFDFSLFLAGFAGVIAVVSINLYFNENENMSPCLRKFGLGFLAKIVLVDVPKRDKQREVVNNLNDKELRNNSEPYLLNVKKLKCQENGCIKLPEVMGESDSTQENTSDDWKLLSVVVDRFSCLIYVILLVTGTVILFTMFSLS